MFWFWFGLWAVLIVGALVGAFFLLRSLWRKAKALLAELDRAGQVLSEVSSRLEAMPGPADPRPTGLHADPEQIHARLAELRGRRQGRAATRRERHTETYRRWDILAGYRVAEDRDASLGVRPARH